MSGSQIQAPPRAQVGAEAPAASTPVFPTSFAQQRLWFLHHLAAGGATYNVPIALRLRGCLNTEALQRALNEIVRRHDVLRTTFPERDGLPVQLVSAQQAVPIRELDLRTLPKHAREREAARVAVEEAVRPFDLATGPLLRALRLRLDEEEQVFLLTMHHIVSDAWSVDVLLRELSHFYDAFSEGKISALPDLPIQYADYALWQREQLSGEALESQLSYWKRKLAGFSGVLDLPTDRARPAGPEFRGETRTVTYSSEVLEGLQALSRREGATLFMTLLAAFQTLLLRLTQQEDIAVGSPMAGRTQLETEGLIGFFVNTLVLRSDLSGDPTFRELLRRVRDGALEAYSHQDIPFEKLVSEIQPERDLSRTPFFQVAFQVITAASNRRSLGNLEVLPFSVPTSTAKFDLNVAMKAAPDGLSCAIEYNSDAFAGETISRWLGHFELLLEGIAAHPDRRLSALRLLSESEWHQLVVGWNATGVPYPRDHTIDSIFEARVQSEPEAVAVRFREKEFTYAELNRRANRLAHRLRRLGIGPGDAVGVCLDRSLELPIALLGILKARAFYVPLDPSYPAERLGLMIRTADVRVVVSSRQLSPIFAPWDASVLLLDNSETLRGEPTENLGRAGSAAEVAYVMFTSGSTGDPKGVAVPHRGVLRLVLGSNYVDLGPDEVLLQLAPTSFDASTFEIWASLLHGGVCVLFPEDAPAAAELGKVLKAEEITTLWLTASLFNAIIDVRPSVLSGVRQLLVGGEALSVDHIRRALETLPATRLINGYGPTENTTFTCCYAIPQELAEPIPSIPIGRPISNTRVYVMDRHLNPVPIGIPGELFTGGDGLAHGYWKTADLTAEKFVPDPFAKEGGGRLYRTGDVVRWLPDGTLQFLGRVDDQVKIRGHRIEPGEVETVLREHPAVRDVAVVARAENGEDPRLIAYVVRNGSPSAEVAELRAFVAARVPEYMVPSVFILLESMPLTPSGKLDRRALPAPGRDRRPVSTVVALPQDTLELVLVRIWEDVLGVWPVGVEDNFFALGGHSLLAVRLFAEIEKVFGRNLPLATLFQAPTVGQLAQRLRQEGWQAPWSSLVVIQGGTGRPPFICVPGVGGNVLGFYELARHLGPDQPVYGLQARGLDGQQEPLTRVEDMAAQYIQDIRAVLPDGPFLLGGASFGGSVAFEMARQLQAAGQRVALVALFDAFAPVKGPSASAITVLRRRLKDYRLRIGYHARNLLTGSGRGAYIRNKARTLRRRIRSRIWQLVYKSYEGIVKPLPPALHDVREAGYLANRRYLARPYAGGVTLFRAGVRSTADASDVQMGWRRVALGGVEVHEIPGDHVNMLVEPHVRILASQLREAIDGARGADPPEQSTEAGG